MSEEKSPLQKRPASWIGIGLAIGAGVGDIILFQTFFVAGFYGLDFTFGQFRYISC
jgi:hypothetical protein